MDQATTDAYLRVSDGGSAPLHAAEPRSVQVDYGHVCIARSKALQAFSHLSGESLPDGERIAMLEQSVRELSDAVLALVSVLTEVVSGIDQRDVHVVGYPDEGPLRPR